MNLLKNHHIKPGKKEDFYEKLRAESSDSAFDRRAEIAKIKLLQEIAQTLNFFKALVIIGLVCCFFYFIISCSVQG